MAKAVRSIRSRSLAALHAGKKSLGWDVEQYRSFLQQMTGKTSSADLSDDEIGRVLDVMRQRGYARTNGTTAPIARATPENPASGQLAKIDELWAELTRLGALNDPSESSLRAFGARVTGRTAPQFMTVTDRQKLIEALKAWVKREAPAAVVPPTKSIE